MSLAYSFRRYLKNNNNFVNTHIIPTFLLLKYFQLPTPKYSSKCSNFCSSRNIVLLSIVHLSSVDKYKIEWNEEILIYILPHLSKSRLSTTMRSTSISYNDPILLLKYLKMNHLNEMLNVTKQAFMPERWNSVAFKGLQVYSNFLLFPHLGHQVYKFENIYIYLLNSLII